eukprot:COSAG02_NODE_3104_length_7366_cov_7.224302_4_plen_145_part_00
MASHTDRCAPNLPIEGARTYAPGISTGAVAVFRAFSTPSPAPPAAVCESTREALLIICVLNIHSYFIYFRLWRAWLAFCRRLAQWDESRSAGGRCSGIESRIHGHRPLAQSKCQKSIQNQNEKNKCVLHTQLSLRLDAQPTVTY